MPCSVGTAGLRRFAQTVVKTRLGMLFLIKRLRSLMLPPDCVETAAELNLNSGREEISETFQLVFLSESRLYNVMLCTVHLQIVLNNK